MYISTPQIIKYMWYNITYKISYWFGFLGESWLIVPFILGLYWTFISLKHTERKQKLHKEIKGSCFGLWLYLEQLRQSGAAVWTQSQLESDWEEGVGSNQSSLGKTSLTINVQCSGDQIVHGCNLSKCHQYPKTGKDLAVSVQIKFDFPMVL